jgi:hypothetical protein
MVAENRTGSTILNVKYLTNKCFVKYFKIMSSHYINRQMSFSLPFGFQPANKNRKRKWGHDESSFGTREHIESF